VWLAQMADRENAASSEQTAAPGRAPQMIVLSQPAFAVAVQAALRHLLRPAELSSNPLLRSRLVTTHGAATRGGEPSQSARIQALQEVLRAACQKLQQAPRTQKLYRSLFHAYLQPAASQEHAAEMLDISLSSFRRHLKEGVARVAEDLWEQEIRAPQNEH
jgi:hypothetical protein